MKEKSYSLTEISTWVANRTVSLPTVQRGFVWKPNQIENLWDSLLRGFPVGAFVLSPNQKPEENKSSFEMLDGQQRATAICLGFGKKTFRDSNNRIKIFIDLEKPRGEDSRKYIFRVITKSHPWGYQRIDNTKTLTSENIRKAMDIYKVEDHLEEPLDKFYPYDALLPVPFEFFLETALNNEDKKVLKEKIEKWEHWKQIKIRWKNNIQTKKKGNLESKEEPELDTEAKIAKRIEEIVNTVRNMIDGEDAQEIPALYLDFDKFKKDIDYTKSQNTDKEPADIDENSHNAELQEESGNKTDEVENLFIRLNAGGTPLRGEELNYSILKSHIDKPGLQIKIESSCEGLFKPSRFITIAYRLFQNKKKKENREAISMKIKPKQFQKTMDEQLTDFEEFLENVMVKKDYDNKVLLEYAKYLLEYNKEQNPYGLPYLIMSKIADNAPEVMFMLLYRLMIKEDRFYFNTDSDLHRKMIGMITLFVWLGKGEKQRDHAKLLSNVWPCVKTLEKEYFWSSSTIQRAMIDNILIPFPNYEKKYNRNSLICIKNYKPTKNKELHLKFAKDTSLGKFIVKMFFNKELILYAQREFLSNHFKKEHYHLDDTNVPFDWDHISPSKYVDSKRGLPRTITYWYKTNGNLRAWPYSLNRIDKDNVPARKLNPLNRDNYHEEEDQLYDDTQKRLEKYFIKIGKPNLTADEKKKELLEWSCCDAEWANCKIDDLKKNWRDVYYLILKRNLSLCKKWYEDLKIDELLPRDTEPKFNNVLKINKWAKNPKDREIKEDFDLSQDNVLWFSKRLKINDHFIYIYFTYEKEGVLEEDGIELGIFEKNSNGFVSKIKISEKNKNKYDVYYNYIYGTFTLISHNDDSYVELFKDFKEWLEKFPIPNKEIKKELVNTFIGSLVKNFQNKVLNKHVVPKHRL